MKTNTNNIIRKSISLLLAIVTLSTIALFCGCGKSNKAQVEESTTTNENQLKLEDLVVVPNVVGMQKEDAIKTLEDAGLVVNKDVSYFNSPSKQDKEKDNMVRSIFPANAGFVVTKGYEITLVVYYYEENKYPPFN